MSGGGGEVARVCPSCSEPLDRREGPTGVTYQCLAHDCLETWFPDEIEPDGLSIAIAHQSTSGALLQAPKPQGLDMRQDDSTVRNADAMAPVIQADRVAAWPYRPSCYKDSPDTAARWNDGVYDRANPVIQAFARCRVESSPADGATGAEQIAENANCSRAAVIEECAAIADAAARVEFGCTTRSAVSQEIANAIRALKQPAGGGEG